MRFRDPTRAHRWAAGSLIAPIILAAGLAASPPVAGAGPAGDRLMWTECAGLAPADLRCANVTVPLDYAHPHGRKITVAISRRPARDPARRHGVLLLTGGGPGNPGVPLPVQWGAVLSPDILATYDLVGFDVRFVERSTPLTCGQPGEEPGGFWIRTAGYASFSSQVAQARQYAQDCQRNAGWALPYATTANAARDLDRIRIALGEPTISFLGGSFAGLLGATYVTLFPRRVDRFVLDSPPLRDNVWRPFELDRTASLEAGLHTFAAFVATGDPSYGLGGTPEAVLDSVATLFQRANTGEVTTSDGHRWTLGELGYLTLLGVSTDQLFPVVALDLASIRAGQAPPVPLPLYPTALPGTPGVPADNHTAVNTAFRCADSPWPRDLATYRRDVADYGRRYPFFGPAEANVSPCAFWPVGGDGQRRMGTDHGPAVLLTAATRDVVVPLGNTLATRAALPGSRLATVDAQYHAPVPYQGSACLMATVTAYLVTGELPAADVSC